MKASNFRWIDLSASAAGRKLFIYSIIYDCCKFGPFLESIFIKPGNFQWLQSVRHRKMGENSLKLTTHFCVAGAIEIYKFECQTIELISIWDVLSNAIWDNSVPRIFLSFLSFLYFAPFCQMPSRTLRVSPIYIFFCTWVFTTPFIDDKIITHHAIIWQKIYRRPTQPLTITRILLESFAARVIRRIVQQPSSHRTLTRTLKQHIEGRRECQRCESNMWVQKIL